MMKAEVGKKTDFGGDAVTIRPLSRERVWKRRRHHLRKNCRHQRVPQTMLIATFASRLMIEMSKKAGIDRARALRAVEDFRQLVRLRLRQSSAPTAPRPPSCSTRLIDEAGIPGDVLKFCASPPVALPVASGQLHTPSQQSFKKVFFQESGSRVRHARL